MVRTFRKKLLVAVVLFCFVSGQAFAFWGLLAPVGTGVMWLGRVAAANVTMARAVEWSIYVHGAIIGWLAWRNSDETAGSTSVPVAARLVIEPDVNAKRDNPDSNRFDDATSGRDPTPKPSFDLTAGKLPMPGSFPEVVQAIGGAGTMEFVSGNYIRRETVTTSSDPNRVASWQGFVTVNGAQGLYYVYDEVILLACPAGYTSAGGTICNLVNASQVQKPSGKTPCEVIRNSNGTWEVDSSNPECAGLSSALSSSGNQVTYSRGAGDIDTVTSNSDGGITISTRGPGGNRDIVTDPYSASEGGFPIRSVTDQSGSGTGGTGGTGGGNCGTAGLPACAVTVDDSGFQGKDAGVVSAAASAAGAMDARIATADSSNFQGNFGIEGSWLPSLFTPGNPVSCAALNWQTSISHGPLAGFSHTESVDLCDKTEVLRQYYSWLWYVLTVWAIALLFFGTNGNARTR